MPSAQGNRRTAREPESTGLETASADEVKGFIATTFQTLYDLCEKTGVAPPPPPIHKPEASAMETTGPQSEFVLKGDQPPALREYWRKKRRSRGSVAGWKTRRAIGTIMDQTPGLGRAAALALHRVDNPRIRPRKTIDQRVREIMAKADRKGIQVTPDEALRRAKRAERAWETRVDHVMAEAIANGEKITRDDAHQRTLDRLQRPNAA